MANAFYGKGKERLLSGALNLVSYTIKAALVKNTYPQDLVADEYYTSISSYVLGAPQTLLSKSITLGVFDANDVTFPTVTAGDASEAVVIYYDTGVPATSPLICYIDTITGFPLATNGGDITVQWDNGAYKIFSL